MAYVTPGTVAAGDVATAAAWNVITNDVIDHESRIRQAAVMAIFKTADTYTQGIGNAIPFTSTDAYDTDAFHDTTTNPSRIVIPTGLGGTYFFEAHVTMDYSTQPTFASLLIRANGSMENTKAIRGGNYSWPTGSVRGDFTISGIAYNCVATDYFDVTIAVTGGSFTATPLIGNATTTTPTYFRAVRISS